MNIILMKELKVKIFNIILVCMVFGAVAFSAQEQYVVPGDVAVFDVWDYFDSAGIDTIEERADALYFITALQGIVNRDQPRLYIFAALALFDVETKHYSQPDYQDKPVTELDRYWFSNFKKQGYFKGRRIKPLKSLKALVNEYQKEVNGLVIWDMKVPASSNLALMAAGCEDLLPVSKDLGGGKFYKKVREAAPWLEVKLDLCGMFDGKKDIVFNGKSFASTGSAKNDVYKYAIEKYLRPGIANSFQMWFNCDASMWGDYRSHYAVEQYGYLGDRNELQQNGMYNADYWVAQKAFFYDLSPWADCKPFDDPDQPLGADNRSWHEILETSYKNRNGEFGIVGGFVPWWIKYTSHKGEKHADVETEWEFVSLLTSYNMANDGDAAFGIANSSFFQHMPHVSRQDAKFVEPEPIKYEAGTTYVAFLMMDYDGSAWTNQMVPAIYDDKARGKLPLNWVINPALNFRIPHAIKYIYENRTANDHLGFSGDGAAYIQPDALFNRQGRIKEDGGKYYEKFANDLNDRYGIKYNAFYIDDTFDDQWAKMAARITPGGFGFNCPLEPRLVDGTPVTFVQTFHVGHSDKLKERVLQIYKESVESEQYSANFNAYRCILVTPTMIYEAVAEARKRYPDAKVEIVDLENYFNLLKTKIVTPVVTPYSDAAGVSSSVMTSKGLKPVIVTDGSYKTAEHNGENCFYISGKSDAKFIYFAVDAGFRDSLGENIEIEFEYFDGPKGNFAIEYNSLDKSQPVSGAYKRHSDVVNMTGSKKWKSHKFIINDASFEARQNERTDFRLVNNTEDWLFIKSVSVNKI
ncbi:MAG: GxGYxYP domain-containing protein [Sedimentisphaeraceae bacterium JB056]